jgi:uncharacterized protein GlcG (DUF336 family)
METLSLDRAVAIIDAALARAAELKLKPLAVAVLDPGGHIIALKRQDEAGFVRVDVAHGKAWGVVAMSVSSRTLEKRALERPHFFQALSNLGPMMPVPGGVLVRNQAGKILGGVGISGDTSDNDEIVAIAGVEAAGFLADNAV